MQTLKNYHTGLEIALFYKLKHFYIYCFDKNIDMIYYLSSIFLVDLSVLL